MRFYVFIDFLKARKKQQKKLFSSQERLKILVYAGSELKVVLRDVFKSLQERTYAGHAGRTLTWKQWGLKRWRR